MSDARRAAEALDKYGECDCLSISGGNVEICCRCNWVLVNALKAICGQEIARPSPRTLGR